MVYPQVKFIYDRRKKASKTTPGTVEIYMSFQRKKKYISTGVSVLPSEWDEQKKVVRRFDAFTLNKELDRKIGEIRDFISRLAQRGEPFTLSMMEPGGFRRAEPKGNFIEFLTDRLENRADITASSRRTQRKIITALKKFGRIVTFSDIVKGNIRAFDQWLHRRGIRQSTVHSYHKTLKTYINIAIVEGLLEKSPYLGMKIDKGKSAPRKFLNDEELEKICGLETTDPYIARARDLFLFQCYTGLAYSDMETFDFTKLREENGRYVLHRQRKKTGVEYHVVLLSPAVDILRRYNFKLPIMCLTKYNLALKAVAVIVGLNFNLTSHCGRHTFATWALNRGVAIDTLRGILGHTDARTTRVYAKLLNSTIEDAFEKLEEFTPSLEVEPAPARDINFSDENISYSISTTF